jgi:hypothetical protein
MKSVLGFIRVCGVFTIILLGVLSLAVLYPFAGRRIAHRCIHGTPLGVTLDCRG